MQHAHRFESVEMICHACIVGCGKAVGKGSGGAVSRVFAERRLFADKVAVVTLSHPPHRQQHKEIRAVEIRVPGRLAADKGPARR